MKMKSRIMAAGMSLVFVAASVLPSQAFVPQVASQTTASSPVVKVAGENRDYIYGPNDQVIRFLPRSSGNPDGYSDARREYRERRGFSERRVYNNRRVYNDRRGYYNGHRGYRDYRRGYRQHNGYWFPLGAFAAGAIIGGAISSQAETRVGGSHVEWCEGRYRSYRAYDNTFQPNNGPRKQCNSPYS